VGIEISLNKSWIIKRGEVYELCSIEDLRDLDGTSDYKLWLSLPVGKPRGFEEKEKEITILLEKIKKELKDLSLMDLIDRLKKKSFEIIYENSRGEKIQTNLLHQIRRAYKNQFHAYEVVTDPKLVEEINFALAEILHRENVGEVFSRLVDERKIPFSGLNYKMKWQAEKLTNPPLKLAYFYGNSFRLREFDEMKLLKHLNMLFAVKEREYRLKQDYSPEIRDAIRDIREYLFPEFF